MKISAMLLVVTYLNFGEIMHFHDHVLPRPKIFVIIITYKPSFFKIPDMSQYVHTKLSEPFPI